MSNQTNWVVHSRCFLYSFLLQLQVSGMQAARTSVMPTLDATSVVGDQGQAKSHQQNQQNMVVDQIISCQSSEQFQLV